MEGWMIRGRSGGDPGSISKAIRSHPGLGAIRQRSAADLGSIRCGSGAGSGLIWGRSKVNPMPIQGRSRPIGGWIQGRSMPIQGRSRVDPAPMRGRSGAHPRSIRGRPSGASQGLMRRPGSDAPGPRAWRSLVGFGRSRRAQDFVPALLRVAARIARGGGLDDAVAKALWREMNRMPHIWGAAEGVESPCARLPGLEHLRRCVRAIAALAAPR